MGAMSVFIERPYSEFAERVGLTGPSGQPVKRALALFVRCASSRPTSLASARTRRVSSSTPIRKTKWAPQGGPFLFSGGEGGIRTHGTVNRTLDFESSPFDHSGTSPQFRIVFVRATGGRRTLDLTRRFAPRPCGAHFVRLSRNFRCARMTRRFAPRPCGAHFVRPNRPRRFVESSPFDHSGTSP